MPAACSAPTWALAASQVRLRLPPPKTTRRDAGPTTAPARTTASQVRSDSARSTPPQSAPGAAGGSAGSPPRATPSTRVQASTRARASTVPARSARASSSAGGAPNASLSTSRTRPALAAPASTTQPSPRGSTVTATRRARARSRSGRVSEAATTVSAVPTELPWSPGPAPEPARAARWSWPARVTGTPVGRRPVGRPAAPSAVARVRPSTAPAAATSGRTVAGTSMASGTSGHQRRLVMS